MNLLHAVSLCSLAVLLMACGGTVARNEGGGSAGAASRGGSSSQAGESARAGSSSVGGGVGTGGSASVGGGSHCEACVTVDCGEGEVAVLEPGACCPTCRPDVARGCEGVACAPYLGCPEGYERVEPPDTCCVGCLPKPGGVACNEIACPQTSCPLGYIRGDVLGGCCYDCVPDPLYCSEDAECVMADKPRACCGCPEAITRRQYDAEPCWSEVGTPRPISRMCFPDATCDAVCAPCPQGLEAACIDHRCTLRDVLLK